MVEPLLLAVTGTVIGSGLNTIRGYLNSKESYSMKKLLGALIPSVFAGIVVGQTLSIAGLNPLAVVLIGLTTGFAIDYAITKAKKDSE